MRTLLTIAFLLTGCISPEIHIPEVPEQEGAPEVRTGDGVSRLAEPANEQADEEVGIGMIWWDASAPDDTQPETDAGQIADAGAPIAVEDAAVPTPPDAATTLPDAAPPPVLECETFQIYGTDQCHGTCFGFCDGHCSKRAEDGYTCAGSCDSTCEGLCKQCD